MRKITLAAAVAAAILSGGCLSYQYEGEKAPEPTQQVTLYSDSAKISQPYTVLGRARVSGNYQEVSNEKLTEKLVEEAKKCGANAILITGQQIVPIADTARSGNSSGGFMTAFDYDETNQSWSQIYRDVDVRYGNIRNRSSAPAASSPQNFKRVMRAEFLQFQADGKADGKDAGSKTK